MVGTGPPAPGGPPAGADPPPPPPPLPPRPSLKGGGAPESPRPPPGFGGLNDRAQGELVIIFWRSLSLHSVEGFAQKSAASRQTASAKNAANNFLILGKYITA